MNNDEKRHQFCVWENVIMLLCHGELSIWYGPHHQNRGIVIYNEENKVIMEIVKWMTILSDNQTSDRVNLERKILQYFFMVLMGDDRTKIVPRHACVKLNSILLNML